MLGRVLSHRLIFMRRKVVCTPIRLLSWLASNPSGENLEKEPYLRCQHHIFIIAIIKYLFVVDFSKSIAA